jgi:L-2-hydroxyglutarate oxidase LhgO
VERIDCLVVGAGVVGLAVAKTLAEAGREVIVVDVADGIGTGTSSRNSEVIHAGLYYPPGSLKAELCVRGRTLLYAYCEARGVEHRRCGKLIVATAPRTGQARRDRRAARACGVDDLEPLTRAEALAMEPALGSARRRSGRLDRHHRQPRLHDRAARRRRARRGECWRC